MIKPTEPTVLLLAIWELIKTSGLVFIRFVLLCVVVIAIVIFYLWATGGTI
jgi:hypothetical protein